MQKIFRYLDQFYMKQKKTSLYIEAYKIFKNDYFLKIKDKLINIIFSFLNKERNEEEASEKPLKEAIQLFYIFSMKNNITLK